MNIIKLYKKNETVCYNTVDKIKKEKIQDVDNINHKEYKTKTKRNINTEIIENTKKMIENIEHIKYQEIHVAYTYKQQKMTEKDAREEIEYRINEEIAQYLEQNTTKLTQQKKQTEQPQLI